MTITPMTLGEIFDRLFKLIGKTWLRSLILVSIIMVLPAVIFILGMDSFFSEIANMINDKAIGGANIPEGFGSMLITMIGFFIGLTFFVLGTEAATLGVTITSCEEMNGQYITWEEALRRMFSIRFLRLIGQNILIGLVIVGLVLIPYILLIAAIAAKSFLLGFFAVLLLLTSIGFIVFLTTNWAFTVQAIGWEDANIFQSFRRSRQLVRGNWWRVFGILLLMNIMLSFAVSLIITPVYLIAMWDFFASYFSMLGSAGSKEVDPTAIFETFRTIGIRIGLVGSLSTVLQLLVSPLYTTVLYFDLRARDELNVQLRQTDTTITI